MQINLDILMISAIKQWDDLAANHNPVVKTDQSHTSSKQTCWLTTMAMCLHWRPAEGAAGPWGQRQNLQLT